jgi:asparagine synthase (glutamine-hydrolysing)
MCGITGVYNVGSGEPVGRDLLKQMTDTLVHRGPDDEGFFLSGSFGLGHRRLSIIDLPGGHQPLANEDQTVWAILNGEIYNFPELREELLQKGHRFRTRSDTEVIVHLYEEEGEACFERLRGMFTVALWDENTRKLLLARDRVGKKPLFYLWDGRRIVFASEMKAILQVPEVPRDIDLEALSDYFSFAYIPAPKSIFKAVRKVLPGHYLVVSPSGLREKQYWDLSFAETEERSEAEWCERLREAYTEAVRVRLMSDVPLGAFLSGGIDSSSTVAVMSALTGGGVVTSSIGFAEDEFNELPYARMVAEACRCRHHEEVLRPDAVGVVETLAWHYDEPFADSSAVPTYYVSKVARKHVTVALSGDGGDENFAGYRRYAFDRRENQLRSVLPYAVRRPLFGALAAVYPKADWAPRFLRAKSTLESLACSPLAGYFRSLSAFRPELKERLLAPAVRQALSGYDSIDVLRHYYEKADTDDPLSRIQYVDIKTYLTDDILVKVDRAAMAVSLEVRAPLLDHKLMELVARIPSCLKLRGTTGKYIFKKALAGLVPEPVLNRKKMGFAIPLAGWFRRELKDFAAQALLNSESDGLLNSATVEKIWNEHQRGLRDRSVPLWAVLMFRLWQREFC